MPMHQITALPRPASPRLATLPERARRSRAESATGILADRFFAALRTGDATVAEAVTDQALELRVPPVAIQALIIAPAMVRIGELWERGVITVADEHVASSISQRALLRLFESMREQAPAQVRERVLLAGVEGQHHVLGLRMVADTLECAGFDVLYLGEDVPQAALREFITLHRPAVVGLTFGVPQGVQHLVNALLAIHETMPEPRIMLGGRAVPPALWDAGYARVTSCLDVVEDVEDLLAGPPTERGAADGLMRLVDAGDATAAASYASDPVAARLAKIADDGMEAARSYIRRATAYRDLALRDALTGLLNRRGFEQEVEALEAGSPGSVLMIDVDDFKRVNDEHGHAVGDRTLQSIGDAIADSIRPHDRAARLGGDEFAVLLPGLDVEAGASIAERIRGAVAARQSHPRARISVGVAPLRSDVRSLLLAADSALYEAKAAGRDRVVVTQDRPYAAAA